jgi:hypothetical protein
MTIHASLGPPIGYKKDMRKLTYAIVLSIVAVGAYVGTRPASAAQSCCGESGAVTAATCNPAGICRACTNCKYCGHCKAGGKCSVCSASSPFKPGLR